MATAKSDCRSRPSVIQLNEHEQTASYKHITTLNYLRLTAVTQQRFTQMGVPAQELPNLSRCQRRARLLLLLLMLLLLHKCSCHRKEIIRRPFEIICARLQLQRSQPCQYRTLEGRNAARNAARKLPYFKEKRRTNAGCAARKYAAVVVKQCSDIAGPLYSLLHPCGCIPGTAAPEVASYARANKPAD